MEKKFKILFILNISLIIAFFIPLILGFLFIPKLTQLYSEVRDCPGSSRLLLSIFDLYAQYWFLVVPVLLVFIFGISFLLSSIFEKFDKTKFIIGILIFFIIEVFILGIISFFLYLPLIT